ncbi:hypothetical protein [Mesonia sp. HuA40]|uniref:hypothetical protein n=1 Tax=Mesonia sp. HuA40 TaxID=2602761 RepID=UPI0011C87C0F|nr:hypothetical protein [Mesonia sp. HuA40]TXK72483.1 hypothetical protein FT993_06505 [Mesonia sp. HuA40]
MKNVFFALAFMLIGSLSFASTNVESNLDVNSENVTELLSTEFNNSLIFTENFTSEKSVVDFGELGCLVEVTIYVNGEYWGSFSTWHADGCGAALRSAADILDQLGF